MYRPPDQDIKEFNHFADHILWQITNENKLVYIMGDFNINLMNEDIHAPTNEFIDTLASYSLYPSITKPTRITSVSATLIDNIFTNSHTEQTSGIILTDISDHLPIFIATNLSTYRNTDNGINTEVREINDINIQVFKSRLSCVNWDIVCSSYDANVSYMCF